VDDQLQRQKMQLLEKKIYKKMNNAFLPPPPPSKKFLESKPNVVFFNL